MRGVKGASNYVQVRPHVPPVEIKRKIEEALRRTAEIDASRITVEANGAEVILRGTVQSWAERDEAEQAAWRASGVSKVDNRIGVEAERQASARLSRSKCFADLDDHQCSDA